VWDALIDERGQAYLRVVFFYRLTVSQDAK
jgi:hypothetical protein